MITVRLEVTTMSPGIENILYVQHQLLKITPHLALNRQSNETIMLNLGSLFSNCQQKTEADNFF